MKQTNKEYNFERVKQLKCECGVHISYSMHTIMSLFDTDYIECPHCNVCHWVNTDDFKIKENE